MDEWKRRRINDCLRYERPDKYIWQDEIKEHGEVPVLTGNKAFVLGYTNNTKGVCVAFPTIIFDDFTTDSKFADFPFKVRSSAIKLLYPQNGYDIYFMYSLMKVLRFTIAEHKRHYISEYKNIEISIPDLPEQRRIVAVLTAADDAIAASRALVKKYTAVKQGLVSDLIGQGEKVSLKELGGRFIRGHGITRADIQNDGVPCIRYGELYTAYDIWLGKPVSHVSEGVASQCLQISHGDLLFTLSGETAEDIGKTVVYLGGGKAVVGGDLAVLTGHKQNPLYLSYILNAPDALKQKELRATGSMVVHINCKKLEEISVPLPSLPEQERITGILTAADRRLTAERERLRKLEDIKRGLMDDLLTNRVNTDKLKGGV
jgi:type I restriction enzyme S subunit